MEKKQHDSVSAETAVFSVIEALPGEAVIIEPHGRILTANSRFSGHFGFTPSLCTGMDLFVLIEDIFHSERLEFIKACCSGVFATGKPVSFEEQVKENILKVTVSPIKSSAGDVVQLLVMLENILQQRVLEQRSVDEKLRYDLALKLSRTGIWEIDTSNGKAIWSDTTWALYGLDQAENEASTDLWLGIVHPDDRETVIRLTESAKNQQSEINIEYRICRADGTVRWCMARGMPIFDDLGKPLRYLGIVADITERKTAQAAITESEVLFRSMFEDHAAVMLLVEPDSGRIVDANQAAANFYGWPKKKLCSMFIQEINTLPSEEVKRAMQDIRSSRKIYNCFQHRNADGSLRDVDVFSTKIKIDRKELLYSVIHDVTKKLSIERKLQESEERFRSMFEDHCACMLVVDPETGRIVDANQAASDFYGWPINRLREMNITDINCASTDFVRSDIRQWGALKHRYVVANHKRADGSIRDVEIFAKKLDIKGRALIYDIIHDITERQRLASLAAIRVNLLEKADILGTEELLRIILDQIEEAMDSSLGFCFFIAKDQKRMSLQAVSTNTSTVMHDVKEKLDRYDLDKAGVWAEAIKERKPLIHNDYASLGHRKGLPAGHAEIKREIVVPVIRNEQVVAAFGLGNKLFDYGEEDAKWLTVVADMVWDIIEKKAAQTEYRNIEARLQQAQKMELVGQLASGIAHEINNPLNFIQLNFSALQDDVADYFKLFNSYRTLAGEQGQDAESLISALHRLRNMEEELDIEDLQQEMNNIFIESQRGIDRIKKIVEGMRNLSSRQDFVTMTYRDINQIVQESLTMAKGEYQFCAYTETRLEKVPFIPCVPDEINQVLLNLIVNSAHAIQSQRRSEKGSIFIHTWSGNGKVHCSITDDGPGIPEEIRSCIFNPFFTTKSPGKGTGLGLSISYDIIVNKHNGEISVDCPPEGGSIFTISLPLKNERKKE
jgi:two-component system, NtrC family, sensor kinase